jgi:FkbM family methyltransferase
MELFERKQSAWRSLRYGLKRLTSAEAPLAIKLPGQGLNFDLPTQSLFARHLYKYRIYEPQISNWLIQSARQFEDGLVIDIGANFGWYSCLLSKLLPRRSILAYEPEPDNFALLKHQLELNQCPNVQPFHLGLGREAGVLKLHKYKASNSGRHSLLALHDGDTVDVDVVALDAHLAALGVESRPIALIKIDIEGYELFALQGARQALLRTRRLVLEYSPDLMLSAGLDPKALLGLLEAEGFQCRRFDDASLQETAYESLRQSTGQMDLLLIKSP